MVEVTGAVVAVRGPICAPRIVVAIALGVVALAVVGMHQLSLGHLFITADDQPRSTTEHGSMAMGRADRLTSPAAGVTVGQDLVPASHTVVGTGARDDCPGCGDHLMGAATCLLALTSLVLCWWLRLPQPRLLPPGLRRTPQKTPPLRRRTRVQALSPTELSVLRT